MEALAHVRYVVHEEEIVSSNSSNILFDAIADPLNIFLIFLTLVVLSGVVFWIRKSPRVLRRWKFIQKRASSYNNLKSWMLRLSLGIALIGGGVSGVLISSANPLESNSVFASFEVFVGFLLMIGFLTLPSVLAAVFLYLLGLFSNSYLIGNAEFLGAAVALLILNNEWPGVDHMIGVRFRGLSMKWHAFVPLVLRLGLGVAMIYLAVYEKFLNPVLTAQVVTEYGLDRVIPVSPAMWVLSTGIIEAVLGLMILGGIYVRIVSVVTVLVLSASFFYFGEAVYSHITLFGVLSVLMITGAGRFSFDEKLSS